MFPGLVKADGVIKDRDQWLEQIDGEVSTRIDIVLNIEDNTPFVQIN